MPISFENWKIKNADAKLMTQERNELLTSFSGGAQKVVDRLWAGGDHKLAQQFSDLVSRSLYVRYDPAQLEEAGGAGQWQEGINELDGLTAFLDEEAENGKTNFDLLMELGMQGDEPAFGKDGSLFQEWLGMLNDTVETTVDTNKYAERSAQIRAEMQAARNINAFAAQEIAPEGPAAHQPEPQPEAVRSQEKQPQPANAGEEAAPQGERILREVRAQASELYAQIKSVDFNLLGMGSREFRDMKNALKSLRDYARDEMHTTETGGVSVESIARYHDLQKRAIGFVEKYLDHKQEDLLKDPSRKNASGRQSHEQPRIKTAVDVLEKLKKSYALGQRQVVDTMRRQGMDRLNQRLAEEQQLRDGIVGTDDEAYTQYMQSVNRTMRAVEDLDASKWSPDKGESLEDFTRRVEKYADAETFESLPADDYKNKNRASHETLKEAAKRFKGRDGYDAGTRMSTKSLAEHYRTKCAHQYSTQLKSYAEGRAYQEAEQGTRDYRADLLSDKMLNNVWDDERFAERFEADTLLSNVKGTLPKEIVDDRKFFPDDDLEPGTLLDLEVQTGSFETRNNILKKKNNYSDREGRLVLENGDTIDSMCLSVKEVQDGFKTHHKRVLDATREAAKRATDKKVKQFYEDRTDLVAQKSTAFMQACSTVPYMKELLAQFVSGLNPGHTDMEAARRDLGTAQVDAVLDLYHAATNEFKLAFKKQELDRKGMTPEEEKQYLRELHQTHSELIGAYEERDAYQDDPAGMTRKYFGNTIAHDLGRGYEQGYRPFVHSVGMINGEKRAIENNWRADELSVLAMIGCIDANLDRLEKYGSPEQKQDLLQMRLEFLEAKKVGWDKYVECSADKKDIADKVSAFVEAHQDDPAWKDVFIGTKALMPGFRKAVRTVGRRAGMDREKDLAFRNEHPLDRLGPLFDEAVKTGEFTQLLVNYGTVQNMAANGKLSKEQLKRYDAFEDRIIRTLREDRELSRKFTFAIETLMQSMAFDQEKDAQYLTEGIQKGLLPIDPLYAQQRKHINVADNYAHDGLLPYGGVLSGIMLNKSTLAQREALRDDDLTKAFDNYLNEYHNMSSPEERNAKTTLFQKAAPDFGHYGFRYNTKTKTFERQQEDRWREDSTKALHEVVTTIANYSKKCKNAAASAKALYEAMEEKVRTRKDPPAELTRVIASLKAVSELNADMTPRQIRETMNTFEHHAKAYLKFAEKKSVELQTATGTELAIEKLLGEFKKDISQDCFAAMTQNKSIDQQKAEAEQQLEAHIRTFPIRNEALRKKYLCPPAQQKKLAAEDAALAQQLAQDAQPSPEKWVDAAMQSAQDSLRESADLLPEHSAAQVVAPQVARLLGLHTMKAAIQSGMDEHLLKIKSPEDFMKAVHVYSKMAAQHANFKAMLEDMTVGSVTGTALGKPDGKGLISAMHAAGEKAEQMQNAPVHNTQLQQNGNAMENGRRK